MVANVNAWLPTSMHGCQRQCMLARILMPVVRLQLDPSSAAKARATLAATAAASRTAMPLPASPVSILCYQCCQLLSLLSVLDRMRAVSHLFACLQRAVARVAYRAVRMAVPQRAVPPPVWAAATPPATATPVRTITSAKRTAPAPWAAPPVNSKLACPVATPYRATGKSNPTPIPTAWRKIHPTAYGAVLPAPTATAPAWSCLPPAAPSTARGTKSRRVASARRSTWLPLWVSKVRVCRQAERCNRRIVPAPPPLTLALALAHCPCAHTLPSLSLLHRQQPTADPSLPSPVHCSPSMRLRHHALDH